MTDYKLEQIWQEDTVILTSSEYGRQIWCKCILRKNNICELTNIKLIKGNKAYRPITNGYNRMHRISEIAMKSICKIANKS